MVDETHAIGRSANDVLAAGLDGHVMHSQIREPMLPPLTDSRDVQPDVRSVSDPLTITGHPVERYSCADDICSCGEARVAEQDSKEPLAG
jgi:hypothetical protein